MTTVETDRLVDDYLSRLEQAAAHLQRARRVELVAEIREHIDAALRQEEAASEVAVRNVLERLGPPEEIVEAAEPAPVGAPAPPRGGKLEIAALVTLVVPLIGWLVGTVLVLACRAWSGREKATGLAILLVLVLLPALAFTVGSPGGMEESVDAGPVGDRETNESTGLGGIEVLFLFLLGLPSAVYLGWRLNRRSDERA